MGFAVPQEALGTCFPGIEETRIPAGTSLYRGKVRDVFDLGDRLLITATDRISAFDRVLSTIPYKGEILNRVSHQWFKLTKHIIPNHVAEVLSGRTIVVKKAKVVPVEVVVRGYLTGSAWRDYSAGKPVSGVELPKGMKRDQAFPEPILTPSTKEALGKHDEPISEADIVRRGIVEAGLWREIRETALSLFRLGASVALRRGLILVDTKYEFGLLPDGKLLLVDEIHTPDSSRYWYARFLRFPLQGRRGPEAARQGIFPALAPRPGLQGRRRVSCHPRRRAACGRAALRGILRSRLRRGLRPRERRFRSGAENPRVLLLGTKLKPKNIRRPAASNRKAVPEVSHGTVFFRPGRGSGALVLRRLFRSPRLRRRRPGPDDPFLQRSQPVRRRRQRHRVCRVRSFRRQMDGRGLRGGNSGGSQK